MRIANSNLPFELSSVVTVQVTDSLLWIIDTAPFFLGLFAFFAGQRQDNLQKLNIELKQRENELETIKKNLERNVEERTTELAGRNNELDQANTQIRRRATQFEVWLSNQPSPLRDLHELLPLYKLILKALALYVGIPDRGS